MSLTSPLSSPIQNPRPSPIFSRTNHPSPKNSPISLLHFKTLAPLPKPLNPNLPMAPLPLRIKIRPQTPNSLHPLRPLSSSSPFPDQNPNAENSENAPPSQSPTSSLFSDIKERLRSPQASPRRIPTDPPPPPIAAQNPSPAASLHEIRKHLAEFRLRSSPNSNPNPNPTPGPCQYQPISFQELFKNSALKGNNSQDPNSRLSCDSIRESLRQGRSPVRDPPKFMSQFGSKLNATTGPPLIGDQENLPESIFGREMREKMGEKEGDGEAKELKTEFLKMYSYDELGEKLRRLRSEAVKKGGKDRFSLEELNLRLAKLRELEEKETESRVGGVSFSDLRQSLMRLKDAETSKRVNMQRMSILMNLNISTTPSFILRPPQNNLSENYFHPDHMSSAEKMKLELKKVRDEFKMSESDCGSARVQIAQLTTKIKHLSSALHKKDKHSRKGLNEMVQRRKKLLKYLRQTDWDSYCFVLSKLGLRDVPEYKVPDYKC